ncbi:MAG: polyphosphate kinase [Sphingobacteriales bacterium]|nr:MAG: polyphosphate kinase [Sphingobacteriales bacterium]
MKINLDKLSTKAPENLKKEEIKEKTAKLLEEINAMQDKLIASKSNSLLVILQGMDASGKDGVVKKVFGGLNPLGLKVQTFKKPTEIEMAHDFLWRIHQVVPQKGEITIFNRSHYEDVLIQSVHHWIDDDTVKFRYDAINNFEKLLEQSGTKIIKCYLHISEEAQLERLTERKTNPEKMWKHNDGDWEERKLWKAYRTAYENAFKYCSEAAPWNIVAVDQNWYKEYQIAVLVKDALEKMDLKYPILKTNS